MDLHYALLLPHLSPQPAQRELRRPRLLLRLRLRLPGRPPLGNVAPVLELWAAVRGPLDQQALRLWRQRHVAMAPFPHPRDVDPEDVADLLLRHRVTLHKRGQPQRVTLVIRIRRSVESLFRQRSPSLPCTGTTRASRKLMFATGNRASSFSERGL